MRRPLACALLPLVALLPLAAGCGGGGGRGSVRRGTIPARPPREAEAPTAPAAPPPATPRSRPAAGGPVRPVAIQSGSPGGRRVALTFDADMTPEMLARLRAGRVPEQVNRQVIDTLRATRTPATLFITGMWAQLYPDEVRSLAADPLFEIGNHTWDHRAWSGECYGLPSAGGLAAKRAEVTRTAQILTALTGSAPHWFRFPGLCHGQQGLRLVAAQHEQAVDGLASDDAFQSDPDAIVRTVLGEVRPGAIVVMHMMGPPNAPATGAALQRLIPALRDRGYELVSLRRLV
jgi:peptidoglycan/xylan/chitin deacetylase (PgdA/CDA1 family)